MGVEIDRERFEAEDYRRFSERLDRCLGVLEQVLRRPGFGEGPSAIGAELEVSLIDRFARPLPVAETVLERTVDPRMTLEIDRFNLECNLLHTELPGRPFAHLRSELESAHAELARAAATEGGRIAMIGILPTLRTADLDSSVMTDAVRYRALSRALRERRGGPFRLDIDGADPLRLDCHDVTYEGAATSFQIHLRVAPGDFRDVFDAAQLATAPALAVSANSPTLLGHRLWDETRVALFKQSVDDRPRRTEDTKPRVALGRGWLRDGPLDLFREAIREHPPLLPVLDGEDPEAALAAGRTPALKEIRLHQGTVWHWNRPVYDPHDGGHVRMELRALPSGPTLHDMVANSAFFVGLCLGLAPSMSEVRARLDFEAVRNNFYRAAQAGLDARLAWPDTTGVPGGEGVRARALVGQLAPIARRGLIEAGVLPQDGDPLIDCIVRRAETGRTGARWQRDRLASLASGRPSHEALTRLLEEYVARSDGGEPVDQWGLS